MNNSVMTIQIRDVPKEVHATFRVWCFQNHVSMNKQLNLLLADFVKKVESGDLPPIEWAEDDDNSPGGARG